MSATILVIAIVAVVVFLFLTRAKQRAKAPSETTPGFYTKIAGISYHQPAAKRCSVGETVELIREPDNPYDRNAVRVCRINGSQLGHLNARLAADLAYRIDRGEVYTATISDITGGMREKPTIGINLHIAEPENIGAVISGTRER